MPDDNPFGPPSEVAPTPEPAPVPAPVPGITPEQFQETIGPLQATLAELTETNAALRNELAIQNQPAPAVEHSRGDFSDEFVEDPQGTIQAEFNRAAAPLIQMQAMAAKDSSMATESVRIGKDWGGKAWSELIAPALEKALGPLMQTQPEAFLNTKAMTNAVDTIVGRNVAALVALKAEGDSEVENQTLNDLAKLKEHFLAEAGLNTGSANLNGGIRRGPHGGATLSDDQTEYVRDMFRADGKQRDSERLATMINTGTSLAEYRAARKSLEKK